MNKVVWIVNEYNGPNVLGTRQIYLSKYLEREGYSVFIICGSSDYKGGKNGIVGKEKVKCVDAEGAHFIVIKTRDYHRSYGRVLVAIQFQRSIWKMRDSLPKPDVIISDFAGLFGNVFLKWKKKYGTNIVYDVLDFWPEAFVDMGYIRKGSFLAKLLYSLEHKSYREANSLIFSMQGGRDYIIDKGWSKECGGDVETSDIGYINNGVDLETVDWQKDKYILQDGDLDNPKFKAVYLGSVSEFNGVDILLFVAQRLRELNIDDIQILVYGNGNQEESLKARARENGLNNIVFKGKLQKEYAMSVLTRADVNVLAFKNTDILKYGTSPNKLFMYFASGRPVLSVIQPKYDLVVEGGAGISVQNDVDAIVKALLFMKELPREQYLRYCKNARAMAELYDYKKLAKELIRYIEK